MQLPAVINEHWTMQEKVTNFHVPSNIKICDSSAEAI